MSCVTVRNDEKIKKYLQEIFTDEFMQKHTNFESFECFRYSSAVITNWEADPMIYDEDLLDWFVFESTEFQNFNEMVRVAAARRAAQNKKQT